MSRVNIGGLTLALSALAALASSCDRSLSITTTVLQDASVGVNYEFALQGSNVDRWVLLAGSLPPGIQFSPSGVLRGVPTQAGVFNFTVQAIRQPVSAPTNVLDQGLSLVVR